MMKTQVFKETKDCWYPSYKLTDGKMLVRVVFTQTGPNPKGGDGEWRVCVWGDDDCGMERDYDNEILAGNMFQYVIGLEYVDMETLKANGFWSA